MEEDFYPIELSAWTEEVAEVAGEYRRIRPGGGYLRKMRQAHAPANGA
ncbi:MAG: hypothetical protein JJU29_03410 [Verrucomicrobia bacterium]|nr:hypothetical protein [Verrucomicrobiota bacterium]MCH8512544.1 hypothetical protein [Kiritimatiellia bacterium]